MVPPYFWQTQSIHCLSHHVCFIYAKSLLVQSALYTTESAKMLVHAFIGSRLDYCKSLVYDVSGELRQNVPARCDGSHEVLTTSLQCYTK